MAAKKNKIVGECPNCGATRFQRFERGEFVDGKFLTVAVVAQCMGAHHVFEAEDDGALFDALRPRREPTLEPLEE